MVYVFLLHINCLSSSVTQKHGKISWQMPRDTGKAIMTTASFILSLHLPSIFWKTTGSKNSLWEVFYGPSNLHVTFSGWTVAPSQNRTSVSQENSQHLPVLCQKWVRFLLIFKRTPATSLFWISIYQLLEWMHYHIHSRWMHGKKRCSSHSLTLKCP